MPVKKSTKNEKKAEETVKEPTETSVNYLEVEEGDAVRISENVISAVVRRYTLEVDGVLRFASNTIVSGLAEMIGRRSHESNVIVDLTDDEVVISVTLVLEFGVRIPEIAAAVQEVIREKVESITGKRVNRVNVVIQDLEEPPSEDEEEAAEKEQTD